MKTRVVLLFGGKSPEHEISLKSAKAIFQHLDKERYEVYPMPVTWDNKLVVQVDAQLKSYEEADMQEACAPGYRILAEEHMTTDDEQKSVSLAFLDMFPVDVVIPIIHGSFGEDGKLQGMLDMLQIPYLGAGVLGSSIGMDKEIQKILVNSIGISVAPFQVYTQKQWHDDALSIMTKITKSLHLPYFVKPANAGSSVGITKVQETKDLQQAIDTAFLYDTKVIIEEGLVDVREVESAVIGNEIIEVADAFSEVIPDRKFYDYDSKYHPDSTSQVIIPASFSSDEHTALKIAAEQVYRILQCSGFARVDFFLGKDGNVFLNEINTLPGFTPVSAFSKMWVASEVSYPELLDKLINLALEKRQEKQGLRYEMDKKLQ